MSAKDMETVNNGQTIKELTERITVNEKLPLLSSNCPGAVFFCERFFPELTDNITTSGTYWLQSDNQHCFDRDSIKVTVFSVENGVDSSSIGTKYQ